MLAKHAPVQEDDDMPAALPYWPAGQLLHAPAPASEYFPEGQMEVVEVTDGEVQKYPAVHNPVQVEVWSAVVAP